MRKMGDWVRHDSHHGAPSSIFWLHGGAGVGKSALAQTLAEKYKAKGILAASFFFSHADANRNDGNRLIPTLAHQFLQSFPEISPFVEEKVLTDPDVFNKNRHTQLFDLLVEPLIRLSLAELDSAQSNPGLKPRPRLVVIDGLDECNGPDIQQDLLRIIANAVSHLPYSLRFLITSRPESHITRVFQHDLGNVARYNLSDDSDADRDIKVSRSRICKNLLHSSTSTSPTLSVATTGLLMRFIQSPQHRPEDGLQVVLGLKQPYEKDRPYARLDSLYTLIFLEIQDPSQLEKVHCALGLIHLRSLKLGLFASSHWTSDRQTIETLLELRPGDIILLLDRLLSLLTFDKDNIRIFHKSLFDYLFDSSRSGDLALDLGLAHEAAANYILREKKSQSGWNLPEFQDFVYHCQFSRLNDTLTNHLRSLARHPENTFTESLSRLPVSSGNPSLLQSMLYFLQVVGRQEFDCSGVTYQKYVRKKNQYLISAVPWSQRLKCLISRLIILRKTISIEKNLRLAFNTSFQFFDWKNVQWRDTNGFNERTPIPSVDMSVIKSIKREHDMLSSFVKAYYRYPDIVVSCWEPSAGLFHSCHVVMRAGEIGISLSFLMLVTYTESGVRLSCSKFEGFLLERYYTLMQRQKIMHLVEEHHQRTQIEVAKNVTTVQSIRLTQDW